jgi:hypothetical protein
LGDYAVDSAPFNKQQGRAIPSAHLRYSTPEHYLVVKGQQAKKPIGYAAIYPVADLLAGREEFMGASFSGGDSYIAQLSTRDTETTTGNASTWRWIGTDHHFARVLDELRMLAGHASDDIVASPGKQAELFELGKSRSTELRMGWYFSGRMEAPPVQF